MSKATETLGIAAARLWPEAKDHLLAVYDCFHADRRHSLFCATMIRMMLSSPETRTLASIAGLRQRAVGLASTRKGPKADRHAACMAALDKLDALVSGEATP